VIEAMMDQSELLVLAHAQVLFQGIFHHLVDALALLLSSPFQFLCQ
jgi:hypothetical protein